MPIWWGQGTIVTRTYVKAYSYSTYQQTTHGKNSSDVYFVKFIKSNRNIYRGGYAFRT